jgi:hypothetical protein
MRRLREDIDNISISYYLFNVKDPDQCRRQACCSQLLISQALKDAGVSTPTLIYQQLLNF